jgi:hypothetical protein
MLCENGKNTAQLQIMPGTLPCKPEYSAKRNFSHERSE